jgi:CubicO group peptidase (beta-lactamase class C family)
MTSGLKWDEWHAPLSSASNDIIGIWFQEGDPVTWILQRPLVAEPGKIFNYSGGNMILLGEIIRNATEMDIEEFSKQYLFEPLGIDSSMWELRYENGVIESAGSVIITPRAMLKIGVTFLNGGKWNGERIISEEWVNKSAIAYPGNQGINVPGEPSGREGYSYSWWTKEYRHRGQNIHMFSAGGWGGQHIFVLPEVNTVVVFTGGNYVTKRPPFRILEKQIIPGIN